MNLGADSTLAMPQAFSPSANFVARLVAGGAVAAVVAIATVSFGFVRSSYMTRREVVLEQPVPFSHEHHVNGVGIDCRYCHTSVETSPFAGVPATSICMNCHTQIWSDSPMLAPVRESYATGQPLKWTRVHDMPDFVYFDHSIHVAKGIGCTTCHGQVDEMSLTFKTENMLMSWCLECHRHPQDFLRPQEEVFAIDYQAPADQPRLGMALLDALDVRPKREMTDCTTCHR